jgi:hypothetical protein
LQQSRVGFVLFNRTGHVIFDLLRHQTNNAVLNTILEVQYGGGTPNIAAGMETAIKNIFASEHGYRPDVNHIMIVLTNTNDSSNVLTQHNHAVAKNIATFAVGIGNGA